MNIQFQICGLCILILLIIVCKSHKTLKLYSETVFRQVLRIMTVSLSADILSLVAIRYRSALPSVLVQYVCKSYIITLIWGAASALAYVLSDLSSEKRHGRILRGGFLLCCVQSAVIYALPLYIFDDGDQVYTYGAAVLTVYLFVGLYILATLVAAIAFGRKMNPRRRFAVILWMLIWLGCAGIQFIFSSLLIVGFASALGVLILFIVMENPEASMERHLGCFNSYGLTQYLTQRCKQKTPFSLLEVTLDSDRLSGEEGTDDNTVLQTILRVLDGRILAFKNANLSLVLIADTPEPLEDAAKRIGSAFPDPAACRDAWTLILVPRADVLSDAEQLFQFLSFARGERKEENGWLTVTDTETVARFFEKDMIREEIRSALDEDRVEVFFQPIYSNAEGRFTSAEALVRIRKTDGSLLPPGSFIPLAEKNGQILELGQRVFEKVCGFLKDTDAVDMGIRYIEVNLSVVQFEQKDLADRLLSIAEAYGVDPHRINLEITETASISARKMLLRNMKQLLSHDFHFSLDDFGKGESNLMYVVEMPVSIVKLDYDMTKAFFRSEKARQVVRAVVGMAHDLGLKTVAEGVETREEAEQIHREGIDYIQGFYYARPMPEQEFLQFLRTR